MRVTRAHCWRSAFINGCELTPSSPERRGHGDEGWVRQNSVPTSPQSGVPPDHRVEKVPQQDIDASLHPIHHRVKAGESYGTWV